MYGVSNRILFEGMLLIESARLSNNEENSRDNIHLYFNRVIAQMSYIYKSYL